MANKAKAAQPRGRPEFQATPALRRTVSIAAGGGMAHDEIAIGLGITRPTLRKHFAYELAHGAFARRLEVLQAMHRAAVKGNVAAQKAYSAMQPAIGETTPGPEQPEPSAPPPEGKKAQAAKAATTAQAGTEWEDVLPHHGTALN